MTVSVKDYIIEIEDTDLQDKSNKQKTEDDKIEIVLSNETDLILKKEKQTKIIELVLIFSNGVYYIKETLKKTGKEKVTKLGVDDKFSGRRISAFFNKAFNLRSFINDNLENIPLWTHEGLIEFDKFLYATSNKSVCKTYSKLYALYKRDKNHSCAPSIKKYLLEIHDDFSNIYKLHDIEEYRKGILETIYNNAPGFLINKNGGVAIEYLLRNIKDMELSHVKYLFENLSKIEVLYTDNYLDINLSNILVEYPGCTGTYRGSFKEICDKYSLDMKRFIEYITLDFKRQNLILFGERPNSGDFDLYDDYLEMSMQVYGKVKDKYPASILQAHRDIQTKYSLLKHMQEELGIAERRKDRKELEHKGKNYSFTIPETAKEIVSEGVSLNHCVASYCKKVAKGETTIVFMRDKKHLDDSLITIEVSNNNHVVQIKGQCNRPPTKEEAGAVIKWAELKGLTV